ncbi:MAG: hypothetical protein A2096_16405 [Spirochaetes bacterium GWF1_41_5]|nr:MAG: hypothetical protein A2096_16405 [Spirochaetes bacterium GWF1_41_5]HBE01371.1 hypothetical protein [Spirochaetia bacterium]
MNNKTKKILLIIFGISLSAAALYYAFRDADFNFIKRQILDCDLRFAAALVLCVLASWLMRAVRWKIITWVNLPFIDIIKFSFAGAVLNLLLPVRLGEVGRAYLYTRRTETSMSNTLGSIFIERVFDGVSIVFYFSMLTFVFFSSEMKNLFKDNPKSLVAVYIISALFVVLLAGIFCGIFLKEHMLVWSGRLCRLLPVKLGSRLDYMAQNILHSFDVLRKKRNIFGIFFSGMAIFFFEAMILHFTMRSLHGSLPLGYSIIIMVLIGFSVTLPSAPGGLGIVEAAVTMVLPLIGSSITHDFARSYVLLYRIGYTPIILIIGFISIATFGVKFSELIKSH